MTAAASVAPVAPVTGAPLAASAVFAHAMAGEECLLVSTGLPALRLPVEEWTREPDAGDRALLQRCTGPTLDVGCGPGRLTAGLAAAGHPVLGIDVVPEAVAATVARGGSALCRDVFGPLPGEGRWSSVLLADGNIGIGGDPLALLARLRRLVAVDGRIVVELRPPRTRSRALTARLRCECGLSATFPWAVVGVDAIPALAGEAGLRVRLIDRLPGVGSRWFAVLVEGP